MGILGWLLGLKREPRLPRRKFADLIAPVVGDEGFPATDPQLKELRKLACGEPPPDLTLRQASLILSARDYSRLLLEDALDGTMTFNRTWLPTSSATTMSRRACPDGAGEIMKATPGNRQGKTRIFGRRKLNLLAVPLVPAAHRRQTARAHPP